MFRHVLNKYFKYNCECESIELLFLGDFCCCFLLPQKQDQKSDFIFSYVIECICETNEMGWPTRKIKIVCRCKRFTNSNIFDIQPE